MEKTREMRTLERLTGKDIRTLITEAVVRAGSVAKAAEEFELTPQALYGWIGRLDGEILTSVDVRFATPADEPAGAPA